MLLTPQMKVKLRKRGHIYLDLPKSRVSKINILHWPVYGTPVALTIITVTAHQREKRLYMVTLYKIHTLNKDVRPTLKTTE